jgi:hypothetical protein
MKHKFIHLFTVACLFGSVAAFADLNDADHRYPECGDFTVSTAPCAAEANWNPNFSAICAPVAHRFCRHRDCLPGAVTQYDTAGAVMIIHCGY